MVTWNRPTIGHHARAAAVTWSSSRSSSAGTSPAARQLLPHHPGHTRRDPARLVTSRPRIDDASGNDPPCADRHQSRRHAQHRPMSQATSPATGCAYPTICFNGRPDIRHAGLLPDQPHTAISIGQHLCPAGSGIPDFRTPMAPETLQVSGTAAVGRRPQ